MMKLAIFACVIAVASAHGDDFPINPKLGVPGFPDCVRPANATGTTVEEAAKVSPRTMQISNSRRWIAGCLESDH